MTQSTLHPVFYRGDYSQLGRPRTLDDVDGSNALAIRRVVRNLLRGNLNYKALMFAGPSGCGKNTWSRLLGAGFHCDRRGEEGRTEPCGECPSCDAIFRNKPHEATYKGHPPAMYQEMDAGSNGLDEFRKELRWLRDHGPLADDLNVLVIDEFHEMKRDIQERFLKEIEDGINNCLFIFNTSRKDKVVNTMINRCQLINVQTPSEGELGEYFTKLATKGKVPCSSEAIAILSAFLTDKDVEAKGYDCSFRSASALMGRAVLLMDDDETLNREVAVRVLSSLVG